jgi:hypothetical protein
MVYLVEKEIVVTSEVTINVSSSTKLHHRDKGMQITPMLLSEEGRLLMTSLVCA